MKTIFISAYPKSGSTWLTTLLGDVLNCPTGGNRPEEDDTEIATQQRPNAKFMVRKGHYKLGNHALDILLPAPHFLNWQFLDNHHRVIVLVRDPRDICISGAYHWQVTPKEFLQRMINGKVARLPRWDKYLNQWLELINTPCYSDLFHVVKYENLKRKPSATLKEILEFIPATEYQNRVRLSIRQNSFHRRKKELTQNLTHNTVEKVLRQHNMRKGQIGDWQNYFTQDMHDLILKEFGEVMKKFNYL